jgi:hypothetical protein
MRNLPAYRPLLGISIETCACEFRRIRLFDSLVMRRSFRFPNGLLERGLPANWQESGAKPLTLLPFRVNDNIFEIREGIQMSYVVDYEDVSTVGLDTSPVAGALAGLRANEARYYMNKYKHRFTVEAARVSKDAIEYVNRILKEEPDIVLATKPLETTRFQVENVRFTYVFYESGLVVNVMYTIDDPKKRAVGFKLSEGMEVPTELETKFKFAKQKSKLAGTIRGSFFVIKGEY